MWFYRSRRRWTFRAVNLAVRRAREIGDYDPRRDRYVVFSDIHKGDRGRSDDFAANEPLLRRAWEHYLAEDFRLVLAGDIEEGWECDWDEIGGAYPALYDLEKRFNERGPGFYLRISGNHDEALKRKRFVCRFLAPRIGDVQVVPAVRLGPSIVILHGHQGELWSDTFSTRGRLLSRYVWRPLQNRFGWSLEGLARSVFMKNARDRLLYEWARAKRLLLVVGHTHRAVFASHTELQECRKARAALLRSGPAADGVALRGLEERIRRLERSDRGGRPPESPNYFNSGCGVYRNGVTAIELADGEIRLVKWDRDALGRPGGARRVLARERLAAILEQI